MTNQSRQSLGLFAIALLFALTALPHDADAQRRGGGGRGGGGRGGGMRGGGGGGFRGGGARPSGGVSRPSGGISRPSGGTGFRDAGFSGGARTSIGGNLSGSSFNRNTAGLRPSTPIAGGGISNRPGVGGGVNRPGQGGGVNRPGQGGNINRGEWNAANIDRDVNIDVDNGWGWGYGAGWGAAAAVTGAAITAAAIGSTVYSLPPSCSAVVVNGVTYQQCGSTWYQPQFVGSTVEYVVVSPP